MIAENSADFRQFFMREIEAFQRLGILLELFRRTSANQSRCYVMKARRRNGSGETDEAGFNK
jgi:hypothetical protein